MHRIQRAFTFKMMYMNLGTSGGATNSLNRALIRSHHTDYTDGTRKEARLVIFAGDWDPKTFQGVLLTCSG